ncbi:hypothetical protein BDV3_001702 [Batrachochytrium dendrobatidis]|uniref:UBX domain-containing protein n=1 Tax=Batrachochytrium dendrobatidis (strain JEL423) TaxID=403673 RepID=A0A177WUW2_BATDL|nr:hypothetical protein QVD99_007007 [Batrachochytrium dendrobatidis]OAJ43201.1 hypothetical protein BDEG_26577 [Batrachochytrium dendrobatidis JEL423]
MASNVTVSMDGSPIKKTIIKTTPSMSLKSIVVQSCEKLGLKNPDLYMLKNKRDTLDLSLSVRFANLAPGAKLTLHQRSSTDRASGSTLVDVALQFENGCRMIDKFETSTRLWDILLHFEKRPDGIGNITRQTSITIPVKQGGNSPGNAKTPETPVYMLPICVFMNQEYNTIAKLKTTSLSNAGLESGNGVIRVMYRHMPEPIDAYMAEIEAKVTPTVVEEVEPTKTMSAPIAKPVDVASQPLAPVTEYSKTAVCLQKPLSEPPLASATNSNPTIAQPTLVQSKHTFQPPQSPLISTNSIKERPIIERDVHIYLPYPGNLAPLKIELPSSFFSLTPAEVKAMISIQQARNRQISEAPLMTRSMREREEEIKRQKHPKTMIRVRFSDQTTLQATFWSGDLISSVYDTVQTHLCEPERPFKLSITPPQRVLARNETFWQSHLAPASIVYFSWADDRAPVPGQVVLNQATLALAKPFPIPSACFELNVSDNSMQGAILASEENDTTVASQSNELIAQEAERERERVRNGLFGGNRDNPVNKDANADGTDSQLRSSTGKVPKWFRRM